MDDIAKIAAERDAILDFCEMALESICSGDDGPVLRRSKLALCARKWEAGLALESLRRQRAHLGESHD